MNTIDKLESLANKHARRLDEIQRDLDTHAEAIEAQALAVEDLTAKREWKWINGMPDDDAVVSIDLDKAAAVPDPAPFRTPVELYRTHTVAAQVCRELISHADELRHALTDNTLRDPDRYARAGSFARDVAEAKRIDDFDPEGVLVAVGILRGRIVEGPAGLARRLEIMDGVQAALWNAITCPTPVPEPRWSPTAARDLVMGPGQGSSEPDPKVVKVLTDALAEDALAEYRPPAPTATDKVERDLAKLKDSAHDILTRLEGVRRIIAPQGEKDGWQPQQKPTQSDETPV